MPVLLDTELLRDTVQSRLGIGLACTSITIDGGTYPALRPEDFDEDQGLYVAIARTPRQVTASIHFEDYAGSLFRRMSEADEASRTAMLTLSHSATALGFTSFCAIEEAEPTLTSRPLGRWRSLEIEVSARLPYKYAQESLQKIAADVTSFALSLPLNLLQLEDMTSNFESEGLPEGAVTQILVNRYERSPANRAACLAHHGTKCAGCGFDFEERYGRIGAGFIEVHHVTPVSKMGSAYAIDPIKDLVPLCSNCHSMVHRSDPPLELSELRLILEGHPDL